VKKPTNPVGIAVDLFYVTLVISLKGEHGIFIFSSFSLPDTIRLSYNDYVTVLQ
jgi:hypothetical protein